MEVLYEKDVAIIETLQFRFFDYGDYFESISNFFDPRYAFLFYAPLIFSFDWKTGKKLMWVIVLVEWSNHLLKWLLHGERPYWWIHESDVYNITGSPLPHIHQFPLTCETGPGSPSGHSQATAAVWFVIIDSFLQNCCKNKIGNYFLVSKLCWMIYFIILAAIGASRVFIAAHFPHQCFFGMFLGWLIAHESYRLQDYQPSLKQHVALLATMFASALSVYGLLKALGSEPAWTLQRALRWCARREYVHLDTTPLFAMMRYSGYAFGMGLAFNSRAPFLRPAHLPAKMLSALLSVSLCLLSDLLVLSRWSLALFYLQAFALSGGLAYCVVAVIPRVIAKVWAQKDKDL